LGRAVPRIGAAEIEVVFGRAATSFPRAPVGSAAGFDPIVESGVARSMGPMTTERTVAALPADFGTTPPGIPHGPRLTGAKSYRPPLRESALADLPPRPGAPGKKAPRVPLDEDETKVGLQLRRELGRERESVDGHAAHLIHLPKEDRDRDEQPGAQARAQAWLDRQVALASDLVWGGARRPSTDVSDAQRQAVIRLFDRPERIEFLTRRLDPSEVAFVRDQSRRGVSPAEFSRRIFEARLLAFEPTFQGVPQGLAKPVDAASLRPLLSSPNDPRRIDWAKAVAEALAEHQTRLIFEDPFQH
jgi:hypothetical protein